MKLKGFVELTLIQLVKSGAHGEIEFNLWAAPSQDGKDVEVVMDGHAGLSKINFTVMVPKE